MKKNIVLIVLSLVIAATAQNNTSDPEARQREVFRTYGYCYGQQRSIDQIKADFPNLGIAMYQAEAALNVTFGKSCTAIGESISSDFRLELNRKFNEALPRSTISEAVARDFINKLQSRAKGDIESPVKETLLTFNPDFRMSPALEFMRGFTSKYSTLGHSKASGLHVELKVPMSWMSREGNRPSIVQFFKGKYGRDFPYFSLIIHPFTPPKGMRVTQKDIDSAFAQSGLKDYIDATDTLIESKPVMIDGEKGAMWVFDTTQERLDQRISLRTLQYMTLYKNRFITLQFATGGAPEQRKEWIAEFEKNRPLFLMIANSLIIMDKYKN